MLQPLPSSLLAGMDEAQRRALLAKCQATYAAVMLGGQPETVAYAQGDGSRSMTVNKVSLPQLGQFIALLQRSLGMPVASRTPMVPYFR